MEEIRIENYFKLSKIQRRGLLRLGITTLSELVFTFPRNYSNAYPCIRIDEIVPGNMVEIVGILKSPKVKKAYRKKFPIAEAALFDDTGSINLTWFHQAYIAKQYKSGSAVRIVGKPIKRGEKLYIANPEIHRIDKNEISRTENLFINSSEEIMSQFIPIYRETKGISSRWLQFGIRRVLQEGLHKEILDPLDPKLLKKYNLPTLSTAIVWIHEPLSKNDYIAARKRFSFEEVFCIQLGRLKDKEDYSKNNSFKISPKFDEIKNFKKRFSFSFTRAQNKVLKDILDDLEKNMPMSRLLEGDVGCGKTAVAATAAYCVSISSPWENKNAHLQTAYMAPTEILARQHFESFIEYFKGLNIQIGLITGTECRKFPSKIDPSGSTKISRTQLIKWVSEGDIPIVIGTHALIQKSLNFKNLALAIIDEQHRFGVTQRATLTKKGLNVRGKSVVPHLLSMTATPIPRTLAMTIFGDLDLSLIDEQPPGRKIVDTSIVGEDQITQVYLKIKDEINRGRQAFVICPRIDEPDPDKALALNVKSAKKEANRLKNDIFPEFEIGLVHSKLRPAEKEEAMNKFIKGITNILVATSVVEVGVNIPNATLIIIEGSERFGLAQLHQLRGRVARSKHQSFCYLVNSSGSVKSNERLRALVTAKNGFELAEKDLNLRGAGTLTGVKQWGLSDIGMEALQNLKMVEAARNEAKKLLELDPDLSKSPKLKERLNNYEYHFE